MGIRIFAALAMVMGIGGNLVAELQNVEVGGAIRIRGDYFDFDSLGSDSFVEQRTRLHVKANFTDEVTAFIEVDSYDIWGEDFRSNYVTGLDTRARADERTGNTADFRSWYLCGNDFRAWGDAKLYQAWIEARNMWGTPLTMRVGRQEIALGNQFLVGTNDTSSLFTGLSFDALRLTYETDLIRVVGIAAKLAETWHGFGDNDVDFYTVYGSYLGLENVVFDAYWMFLRDDYGWLSNLLIDGGDLFQHTAGLRAAGTLGAFDFNVEAAYQFGSVDDVKNPWYNLFDPSADVDIGAFAVNAEAGYTFDAAWTPRVFGKFAYLDGGDQDDSCWNNDRTLPFDRLYSNIQYSEFLDDYTHDNGALSNAYVYALGVQASPLEKVSLKLLCSYLRAGETAPSDPGCSKELGWELGLYADYRYSEDLVFRTGYAHLFGAEGLETPAIRWSGLTSWDADADDNYDYVFVESELRF